MEVEVGPAASAVATTQAAEKIYRAARGDGHCTIDVALRIGEGAGLEWLPQETIVFDGARAASRTVVKLRGTARFAGWEILCLGRPASGERFNHGTLAQDFQLHHDDRPLLLDRLRLSGDSPALGAQWGLVGAQALGTLLVYPARDMDLDSLRQPQWPDVRHAITRVDGVLVCRALCTQAEPIRQLFTQLWLQLRPALLGRQAVAPRIWAT
jgi:urease accessory protein